jgi:uncharacterized membrane protein
MSNTLYAAFNDAALAEKAAGALLDHGVRAEDLSLVQHESRYSTGTTTVAQDTGISPRVEGEMTGARMDSPGVVGTGTYVEPADMDDDFAVNRNQAEYDREMTETDADAKNVRSDVDDVDKAESSAKHGLSTTTGADAGHAAVTGGAWGLGIGAVAALASLLIPGVGIVVGGGALATAIAGLVATTGAGAVTGAVTGYLKDQGVEEQVAQKYGETVTGGGAILALHVPSGDVDEAKARQMLEKYGATNVNTYALSANARPYVS